MKRIIVATLCILWSLTACVVTEGPRTTLGARITVTEWKNIGEEERLIYFVGSNDPKIRSVRQQIRDSSITHQRINFSTKSSYRSHVFIQHTGARFSLTVNLDLADKKFIIKRAQRKLPDFRESNIKENRNKNGEYLSVSAVTDTGVICVYARQGRDLESYAEETEVYYEALIDFFYCDEKSERAILDIFDSIRIRS